MASENMFQTNSRSRAISIGTPSTPLPPMPPYPSPALPSFRPLKTRTSSISSATRPRSSSKQNRPSTANSSSSHIDPYMQDLPSRNTELKYSSGGVTNKSSHSNGMIKEDMVGLGLDMKGIESSINAMLMPKQETSSRVALGKREDGTPTLEFFDFKRNSNSLWAALELPDFDEDSKMERNFTSNFNQKGNQQKPHSLISKSSVASLRSYSSKPHTSPVATAPLKPQLRTRSNTTTTRSSERLDPPNSMKPISASLAPPQPPSSPLPVGVRKNFSGADIAIPSFGDLGMDEDMMLPPSPAFVMAYESRNPSGRSSPSGSVKSVKSLSGKLRKAPKDEKEKSKSKKRKDFSSQPASPLSPAFFSNEPSPNMTSVFEDDPPPRSRRSSFSLPKFLSKMRKNEVPPPLPTPASSSFAIQQFNTSPSTLPTPSTSGFSVPSSFSSQLASTPASPSFTAQQQQQSSLAMRPDDVRLTDLMMPDEKAEIEKFYAQAKTETDLSAGSTPIAVTFQTDRPAAISDASHGTLSNLSLATDKTSKVKKMPARLDLSPISPPSAKLSLDTPRSLGLAKKPSLRVDTGATNTPLRSNFDLKPVQENKERQIQGSSTSSSPVEKVPISVTLGKMSFFESSKKSSPVDVRSPSFMSTSGPGLSNPNMLPSSPRSDTQDFVQSPLSISSGGELQRFGSLASSFKSPKQHSDLFEPPAAFKMHSVESWEHPTSASIPTSHTGHCTTPGLEKEQEEQELSISDSSSSGDHFEDARPESRSSTSSGKSDDDVPLAERHPTALQAQKSLRVGYKSSKAREPPQPKPTMAFTSNKQAVVQPKVNQPPEDIQGFKHENSTHTPFDIGVLNKKLLQLQQKLEEEGRGRNESVSSMTDILRHGPIGHSLLPQTEASVKTRAQRSGSTPQPSALVPFVSDSVLMMSSEDGHPSSSPSINSGNLSRKPTNGVSLSRRPTGPPKKLKPNLENLAFPESPRPPPTYPPARSLSAGVSREPSISLKRTPPIPPPGSLPRSAEIPQLPAMQASLNQIEQKIYIGDQTRYCTVIIESSQSVKKLLDELQRRKELSPPPDLMGWSIWEVYSPMGLERPLRYSEILMDILKSWSTQARSCFFVARPTIYARWLTNESFSKSVNHGAYVHYETKKGSWNKRFLRLNDHSLSYTKSDTSDMKKETFLCTLTNFDIFLVTPSTMKKLHAPRQFAFAIKSTDPITFFENVEQDYIHFFSVKTEAELEVWLKVCLTSERRGGGGTSSSPRSSIDKTRSSGPLMRSIPASEGSHPIVRQASRRRPSLSNGQFTKGSLLESSSPPIPALPTLNTGKLTMPDQKTWERMTPEQRKEWLKRAQNNARSAGGTLLDFGKG